MHWLNNLSLKVKLGLLAGVAVVGLTVFGITAYATLNTVKIGGAEYAVLKNQADALADILTPPANPITIDWYVRMIDSKIEAGKYQEAQTLYQEYRKAFQDYEQRVAHWKQHPEIYNALHVERPEVQAYLRKLKAEFEPAFERGDWARVQAFARESLEMIIDAEAQVDIAAEKLVAMQQAEEKHAAALVRSRSLLMAGVFVAVLALIAVLSFLIARQILGVVRGVQRAAAQLAQGDLTVQIHA
ncbi:MAG: hypothetical protein N2554_04370, partial [Fimbriimonadales bacterium]|nr:hypothetical protein [Fimbriimonadales bacterium]